MLKMECRSLRNFLLLVCLGILLTKVTQIEGERCAMSQFTCANERCIPKLWKCDEEDDCNDGSDEEGCPSKLCADSEFQCNNGKCIPERWQCDGDEDCSDGSDESPETCKNNSCTAEQFSCGEGMPCIPNSWKCDGQEDCNNGNDELGCRNKTCGVDEYTCKNGKCITARWVCDQDNDCGDNSDEDEGCPTSTCSPSEVMCNDSRCIPERWKCDGDTDCHDNSDEMGCAAKPVELSPCSDREFTCGDYHCIHQSWKCDGDKDCTDGSDEEECPYVTCGADQIACKNQQQCKPSYTQCDGKDDCDDKSDEEDCPTVSKNCNLETEFDCTGDGTNCIDRALICNKKNDCGNGEDESTLMCGVNNPCKKNNGGCSDTCLFMGNRSVCACSPGYVLNKENQKTCEDIDECSILGKCSQLCDNIKGTFKCSCHPGYQKDPHTHACKAVHHPFLLFANRHDIREINLETRHYRELTAGLRSAIALDYDYETKMIYWSDVAIEKIQSFNISNADKGKDAPAPTTIVNKTTTADGIAFDWIHKNLYWTDTGDNSINVKSVVTQFQKKLISNDLDEPRAIVVDPRPEQGYMYWTDWGENAKIEKCGLDGSRRQTIVSTDMQWPNGLAIDYVSNRLFWVDAKLRIIGSSDLNGQTRSVVLTSPTYLKHPFGIAVFEDLVYWTDWETESIHSANKFDGSKINTVVVGLNSPMDLQVYHDLKQTTGSNTDKCAVHHCSHMCLPVPFINEHSAKYSCACPEGWEMNADRITCKAPVVEVSTSAPALTSLATDLPLKPGQPKSKVEEPRLAAPETNIGVIAGIVVGAISVVAIIIAIIAYLVYRSYVKRNIQSMNFDNPVYRKTTEDQFSLEKNQYQPSSTYPSTLEPLTSPSNELV